MASEGGAAASEWHRLLVVVEASYTGSTGGAPLVIATQVARHPDGCAFHAVVAEPRQLPLVIAENGIAGGARGWEFRAPGLWADHVCETPDEHWSYGLEAFALAIDDPEELLGRGYGQRVPLGWELEFEAVAPPQATGPSSLVQAGVAHGLLLGADRRLAIEGRALRGSALRPTDDPATPPADTGWRLGQQLDLVDPVGDSSDGVVTDVALPTPDGVWWVARTACGVRTRGW